ncbi:MAG: GNAT family N-acetyltransferase [Solirubrobacteraceae bacterium]|nr:GNAT family N-acetyltransferase [Solirubrobacteraceae bacterium]
MTDAERAATTATTWAAEEGWNPGLDDAARFLAADPGAFLATERDGAIVATVSCARYGEAFAFIGHYLVRGDLRGRGLGHPLFTRALEQAGDRVTGLDGVLEQQASYERRGFVLAHRNVRRRIAGGGARPPGLVEVATLDPGPLLAYDTAVAGYARERFLRAWIDRPPGCALAAVRGEAITGYGVLRPCRTGWKIGPLFADDAATATALLDGLLATAGAGTEVFLDTPEANPGAPALLAGRAAEPVFETARMYRAGRIPEDTGRVFGVTTLELG